MDIFINGTKLNDLVYVENVQGVHDMPNCTGNVNQLATSNRSYYVDTTFDERVITITCTALMEGDGKLLSDKMDKIKAILAPSKCEKELVFGAYPDRYLLGRVEGTFDLTQVGQIGMFMITFYCSDPIYYSKKLYTSNTPVTAVNAKNTGNWESQKLLAELTVNGTVDIKNTTTGEVLRLKSDSAKNVTIDFEKACIIGGVADNANTLYVSGSFFTLEAGDNHLTSTVPTLFKWRTAHL